VGQVSVVKANIFGFQKNITHVTTILAQGATAQDISVYLINNRQQRLILTDHQEVFFSRLSQALGLNS
jgi:myo-inositol-hexaphosphate 3-phosphohydrolase